MNKTHCKLSRYKQLRLIEAFVGGVTARKASELVAVNRNTAALFYHKLRQKIATKLEDESPVSGEIEVDESYFGGHRKGKRGRGAAGKIPVFGLLKRGGKVYTKIIPDAKASTLIPLIERKVVPDSIVYSDCYAAYDQLDVIKFHHFRINHSVRFANEKNHINGIENFWNQAKRHMRRFNGIPKKHFYLFLKECEFRFNIPSTTDQINFIKSLII